MSAHSPTPWVMRPSTTSPANIQSGDDCIAKVYLTDPLTKRRDAMHLANRDLILAAPDLLECLKNLLFYHYHEIEMPAKGTRDREVYDAARAAIAKAGGKL